MSADRDDTGSVLTVCETKGSDTSSAWTQRTEVVHGRVHAGAWRGHLKRHDLNMRFESLDQAEAHFAGSLDVVRNERRRLRLIEAERAARQSDGGAA